MRLARASGVGRAGLRWWSVVVGAGLRSPVVGIETGAAPNETDQWLLSDHGVRHFRYRGEHCIDRGPPVPTFASQEGFAQVRTWLRYRLPALGGIPALPSEALSAMNSTEGLIKLLEREWVESRIDPPSSISPEKIAAEMEAFPHGVLELLAATESLGG